MVRLELSEPVIIGDVKLVPFMSDAYFRVAAILHNSSAKGKQNVSLVAGVVLITAAGIESYVNELLYMTNKKSQYSLPKSIEQLKRGAANPQKVSDKTYQDIKMLYGLRGLLAHYQVNEEISKEVKTSLQKIQRYFPDILDPEKHVSLEKLLNPDFSEWVMNLWCTLIQELYTAGYEPPRPFWIRQLGLRKI